MNKIFKANPEEWDKFVNKTAQKSIFSLSQYNQFSKTPSQYWLSRYQGRTCVGMLIANNELFPNYSMYQGIYIDKKLYETKEMNEVVSKSVAHILNEVLVVQGEVNISLHPSLIDVRFLSGENLSSALGKNIKNNVNLNYTGIIDLDQYNDFDDYLLSVRKCRRYEYKKCLNKEIVVEINGKIEEFDLLHDLTFSRQNLVRSKKEQNAVVNIMDGLMKNMLATIFIARNKENGEPMSSVFFSFLDKTAYYQFGATDPKYRKNGISTYVLLEAIRKAWEKGCKIVDVVGINSPNRGDLKTSLNSKPTPYYNCAIQYGA